MKRGGIVLSQYPEIGVTIAQSDRGDFAAAVHASGTVESVGPTRTAPVDALADSEAGSDGGESALPVEPDVRSVGDADPAEAPQWDMTAIHADVAHQVNNGGADVLVGVLDSGVDSTHPDLAAQLDHDASVGCTDNGVPNQDIGAWSPTTSSHGTHVAGTIAADDNGVGIVGVAPDVRLASVKVVDDAGKIYPEYAICGIVWAAEHGFDVTNNSYYIDPWQFWCGDQADQAAALEAVRRAFAWATSQGVLSTAAAGNSNVDLAIKTTDSTSPNDGTPITDRPLHDGCLSVPAELPDVIAVSSLAEADDGLVRSSFSNYGEGKIDVAAPGSNVLSTVPGGGYGIMSGTSMASPHVAGVAALLKTTHPEGAVEEIATLLRSRSDPLCCPEDADPSCGNGSAWYGGGVVNGFAAVTEGIGLGAVAAVAGGTAQAGAVTSIVGVGFDTGERVKLSIDGEPTAAKVSADARGRFSLDWKVPPGTPVGAHAFALDGSKGQTAAVNVRVTAPIAAPSIERPRDGEQLEAGVVTASGRAIASAAVRVVFEDRAVAEAEPIIVEVRADSIGAFLADAELPDGDYRVSASQTRPDGTESLSSAPVDFTVGEGGTPPTPEPKPDPEPNPDPGTDSGSGGSESTDASAGRPLANTGADALGPALVAAALLLAGIVTARVRHRHG